MIMDYGSKFKRFSNKMTRNKILNTQRLTDLCCNMNISKVLFSVMNIFIRRNNTV